MKTDTSGAKRKQFDQQVRKLIGPVITSTGYEFDGRRIFRRPIPFDTGTAIQIIEFQIGIKSLTGRFTVNLGVFSDSFHPQDWPPVCTGPRTSDCLPAMWKRLGYFYDTPQSLLTTILGRTKPKRGDYWWDQHAGEREMINALQAPLKCLLDEGLPWLEKISCKEAFQWATSELARAKKWKESRSTSEQGLQFELRYYKE
jgi:hypothetical protein